PLRPERSALPGCATPRDGLQGSASAEIEYGARAHVGPLADQQVAAVGDQTQLRVEETRVLEAVLDRHLPVAGAEEDERRTADALDALARVAVGEREPGAERIGVQPRAL